MDKGEESRERKLLYYWVTFLLPPYNLVLVNLMNQTDKLYNTVYKPNFEQTLWRDEPVCHSRFPATDPQTANFTPSLSSFSRWKLTLDLLLKQQCLASILSAGTVYSSSFSPAGGMSRGESQLRTPRFLSPHRLLKCHWTRKPEVPPLWPPMGFEEVRNCNWDSPKDY